jgi:hypothetical protein
MPYLPSTISHIVSGTRKSRAREIRFGKLNSTALIVMVRMRP